MNKYILEIFWHKITIVISSSKYSCTFLGMVVSWYVFTWFLSRLIYVIYVSLNGWLYILYFIYPFKYIHEHPSLCGKVFTATTTNLYTPQIQYILLTHTPAAFSQLKKPQIGRNVTHVHIPTYLLTTQWIYHATLYV